MAAVAVVTVVFTQVCITITTTTFATGLEAVVVVVYHSVLIQQPPLLLHDALECGDNR